MSILPAEIAFTVGAVLIATLSTIRCVYLLWNWSKAASFTAKCLAGLSFLISLLQLIRCIDMHGNRGIFSFTVSSIFTDNVTLLLSIGASISLTQFLSSSSRNFWRLGLLNPQLNRRRTIIRKTLILQHIFVAIACNIVGIVLTQFNKNYIKSVVFWTFMIDFSLLCICTYFATTTLIETTKRYITLLLHPPAAGVAISSQQNQQSSANPNDPTLNMDTVTYLNYIMNYDHHQPQSSASPTTSASQGHSISFFPSPNLSVHSASFSLSSNPAALSSSQDQTNLFSSQSIQTSEQPYIQLDTTAVEYAPMGSSGRNSPRHRPSDPPPATIGLDLGDGSIVSVIVDNRHTATSLSGSRSTAIPQSNNELSVHQYKPPSQQQTPDYNHTISHTTHLLKRNPFYQDNEMMFNRDTNFTTVAGQAKPAVLPSNSTNNPTSMSFTPAHHNLLTSQTTPSLHLSQHPPPIFSPVSPLSNSSQTQRNHKVATIDTCFPNELELELKDNLSPDLQQYWVQWRADIREIVFIAILSCSLLILAVCALFFFGVQSSRSSAPIEPSGSFFEDDFLSWVQIIGVFVMLYISVSRSAVSNTLDWNDQKFLLSALGQSPATFNYVGGQFQSPLQSSPPVKVPSQQLTQYR